MKIRYFTLNTKNEYAKIHLRFWDGRKYDKKTQTGLQVKKTFFSNAKQKVKNKADCTNKDFINNTLDKLKTFIFESYVRDYAQNKIYPDWLKDKVNAYFNRKDKPQPDKVYFADWINTFIQNADKRIYNGKPITERTKKSYKSTYNKIKEFETIKQKRLTFQDINLKFYNDFISYCIVDLRLNKNSTGSHIKNIKLFCRSIDLDGLPIHKDYKRPDFKVIKNESPAVYLTDTEINKIYNFDLSYSQRLQNAKDLFIIGLRTGLRISDFMYIKEVNLKQGFIHIETQKTGQKVIIPLHPQIKEIYNRRGGLPYAISHQKFNQYIKEICQLVGIDELTEGAIMNTQTKRKETGIYPKYKLVSSHTCRRSFASNLYGKLPNRVIMDITGHKTETQFLKYIKITKEENAETLRKFWANEQKDKGYTNVLQVTKKAN